MFWIEPLVLDGLQASFRIQECIDAVQLVEQMLVVRHELVFAVLDVGRGQLHVVVLELADEVFQRHRVPHNLVPVRQVGLLHGLLHVVVGNGVFAPAVVQHQVVAEAAFVDDDMMAGQVTEFLDLDGVVLLVQHAMGENLDDGLAV